MIELTVDNKLVNLPDQAKISIEKTSPVLNEKVGSFSYPFPVPTDKNRSILGYPGRLERVGDLSGKSFMLKNDGIQILRGEVAFDSVTEQETGIILQSGNTEFSEKMYKKKLGDLSYGSQAFPYTPGNATEQEKLDGENPMAMITQWTVETLQNKEFVLAPFWATYNGTAVLVNPVNESGYLALEYYPGIPLQSVFCFQFKLNFILKRIFENAGYIIQENQFENTEFIDAVLFGKLMPFSFFLVSGEGVPNTEQRLSYPPIDTLYYADLMPEIDVLDFVEMMKAMFCLAIDINESKRSVSIYHKKGIFEASKKVAIPNCELAGWEHNEEKEPDGFKLYYQDQEDELATSGDYTILETVATINNLPVASSEYHNMCVHVANIDRDFQLTQVDSSWEWKRVGRLKPYTIGKGDKEFDINVNIPANEKRIIPVINQELEAPVLPSSISSNDFFQEHGSYISLYRNYLNLTTAVFPYISNDQYFIDGSVNYGSTLAPEYLYENYHKEFINWQTYRAREVTKYLKLTLAEVVSLQWRKRYVISGIAILLNTVNFELPHTGIVKVNGFTT